MSQPHTMSHRADPSSSKVAAREHVESGRNAKHKQLVWELLMIAEREQREAATAGEIHAIAQRADWYGPRFDVVTVRRRLFDLAHDGKIERHAVRKCHTTKRPQLTWLTVRQTKLSLVGNVGNDAPPTRKELIQALEAATLALETRIDGGRFCAPVVAARAVLKRCRR